MPKAKKCFCGEQNHLVLCIDVRLVLQKQDSRKNGRDVRRQMQGCIAVDVHEVRLGMILQQYAHAALMLALHCLIKEENDVIAED